MLKTASRKADLEAHRITDEASAQAKKYNEVNHHGHKFMQDKVQARTSCPSKDLRKTATTSSWYTISSTVFGRLTK
jgi:hypothetical protein